MKADAPLDFYSTVAQVIPIVFALLVLELRVLQRHEAFQRRPSNALGAFSIVLSLGLAEYLALDVLHGGDVAKNDADIVIWIALLGGGLVVVALLVRDPLRDVLREASRSAVLCLAGYVALGIVLWGASAFGLLSFHVTLAFIVIAPLLAWGYVSTREDIERRRGAPKVDPVHTEDR